MSRMCLLAGVAALGMLASAANAAVISIDSVIGKWTLASPPSVQGVGTNHITWGTPQFNDQSGYIFTGNAPPPFPVAEDVLFDLGTFTHENNPIFAPSLTSATLEVTTKLFVDGVERNIKSTFEFNHWETPNNDQPCADGGNNGSGVNQNGCADRVTFTINVGESDAFSIDGTDYYVDISGFLIGNSLATAFWTKEKSDNMAILRGIITSTPGGGPNEAPEPAALALLGLGVAGIGLARRRRG